MKARRWSGLAVLVVAFLSACATDENRSGRTTRPLSADEGRTLVSGLLPPGIPDRAGWARDLFAAIASLQVPPTRDNVCAAIAVVEQESGFRADPRVPGLAAIARKEIERRREQIGIPKLVLDAALALPSSNGKSYAERIDSVTTELQMSDIFDDFISKVPFGQRLLADRNPVHTGGPMQVGIAFAQQWAASHPYPYAIERDIRHEVFTRRGGVYFGVAHLLAYQASYDQMLFRFADFNAGQYSSRNAGFQAALTEITGIPLTLDGDLLRYEAGRPAKEASSTELALRTLATRLDLSDGEIRRDLEHEKEHAFEKTDVYRRVFRLADALSAKRARRAVLPTIDLQGPKITRKLTTEWYANSVDRHFQRCLKRGM